MATTKENADILSDMINGRCGDTFALGVTMTKDHRYLVNEWFKVFYAFALTLAKNYEKHLYDARNEWACKQAHDFITKCGTDRYEIDNSYWDERIQKILNYGG